jgi:PTS system nitrogen regulatory IIA component
MDRETDEKSLADLVNRGGVYDRIPGDSPGEFLAGFIDRVPLPPLTNKDRLLAALLEREALMSTGIGRGVALPHPRNPVIDDESRQFVSLAFPAHPLEWKALDGKLVHTALLIVSASAKQHLQILSKVNFLCRQESFYQLLLVKASREQIVQAIRDAEYAWKKD